MKNTRENNTNAVCWEPISNRDLITETMQEKGMTRAEAFRWLYQCAPVFIDNDLEGSNHG